MKKTLSVLLLTALLATFSACNTFHGVGKDLESAGKSIERASDKK